MDQANAEQLAGRNSVGHRIGDLSTAGTLVAERKIQAVADFPELRRRDERAVQPESGLHLQRDLTEPGAGQAGNGTRSGRLAQYRQDRF